MVLAGLGSIYTQPLYVWGCRLQRQSLSMLATSYPDTHFPCAGSEVNISFPVQRSHSLRVLPCPDSLIFRTCLQNFARKKKKIPPKKTQKPNKKMVTPKNCKTCKWISISIALYPLEMICNCLQMICVHKELVFMYFYDSGSSFLQSSLAFCCSEHAAQKGPWFFYCFPVFCVSWLFWSTFRCYIRWSVPVSDGWCPDCAKVQLYGEFIRQIITGVINV